MKRCIISIAVLLVVVATVTVPAAEDDKQKGKAEGISARKQDVKRLEGPGRLRRIRGEEARAERTRGREQQVRGIAHAEQLKKLSEQIKKKRGEHKEFVDELNTIKKLALEEKAKKTAKRLQQLINKSENEFKEEIEKLEQRHAKIKEQVEKQAEDRAKRRERLMKGRGEQQEKGKGWRLKGRDKSPGEAEAKDKSTK